MSNITQNLDSNNCDRHTTLNDILYHVWDSKYVEGDILMLNEYNGMWEAQLFTENDYITQINVSRETLLSEMLPLIGRLNHLAANHA